MTSTKGACEFCKKERVLSSEGLCKRCTRKIKEYDGMVEMLDLMFIMMFVFRSYGHMIKVLQGETPVKPDKADD